MSIFKVYAKAYNRNTKKPVKITGGKYKNKYIRMEVINTKTNKLFENAKTIHDVKIRYESFWNDMNPHSEEIVKVIKIK